MTVLRINTKYTSTNGIKQQYIYKTLYLPMDDSNCRQISRVRVSLALPAAHLTNKIYYGCREARAQTRCRAQPVLPDWRCPSIVPEAQNYRIWKKMKSYRILKISLISLILKNYNCIRKKMFM